VKQPLVSIITPCFNSDRFIKSCIESVLAQPYRRVEHIVQDGASGDDTVKILRKYSGRIDWVSEPDAGQADGLNRAILRSRGDFLLVLNADDELLPHAVEWGVSRMMENPDAAVVYGDLILMDETGKETGSFLGPDYDFAGVFCVEKVIGAQAAFIRRSMFEQVGIGADPSLDTCPDYEMFIRLGLKFPIRHVPGFVARYRYYPRVMDGSTARSVNRFVESKSAVMERVFKNPATPKDILRLRRRAKAGLFLWASQEARNMSDIRGAWRYYAKALKEFSILGRLASQGIFAVLRWREGLSPEPNVSLSPDLGRALWIGASLAREPRSFSILFSLASTLIFRTIIALLIIITVGLLALILYLVLR
jgi:glycosyltransferase involved in cell wall biosynthesis